MDHPVGATPVRGAGLRLLDALPVGVAMALIVALGLGAPLLRRVRA